MPTKLPASMPKILVAEDEMIVAFDLCETLEEAGFQIDGPHATIASARRAIDREQPVLAILDVSLRDDLSYPLAKDLETLGVTVIFYSGLHSRESIKRHFPEAKVLMKPCPPADVLAAVSERMEPVLQVQPAVA